MPASTLAEEPECKLCSFSDGLLLAAMSDWKFSGLDSNDVEYLNDSSYRWRYITAAEGRSSWVTWKGMCPSSLYINEKTGKVRQYTRRLIAHSEETYNAQILHYFSFIAYAFICYGGRHAKHGL